MTDLVTDLDGEWSTIRLTRPIRGRGRRSCEATRRSWPVCWSRTVWADTSPRRGRRTRHAPLVVRRSCWWPGASVPGSPFRSSASYRREQFFVGGIWRWSGSGGLPRTYSRRCRGMGRA